MIGKYEITIDAETEEKRILNNKSIPLLKEKLLELANNISIPYNKELLIDIIIDMKKENGELPK